MATFLVQYFAYILLISQLLHKKKVEFENSYSLDFYINLKQSDQVKKKIIKFYQVLIHTALSKSVFLIQQDCGLCIYQILFYYFVQYCTYTQPL